jgi:hypothetical protein
MKSYSDKKIIGEIIKPIGLESGTPLPLCCSSAEKLLPTKKEAEASLSPLTLTLIQSRVNFYYLV